MKLIAVYSLLFLYVTFCHPIAVIEQN